MRTIIAIKDLARNEELDKKAMASIVGGLGEGERVTAISQGGTFAFLIPGTNECMGAFVGTGGRIVNRYHYNYFKAYAVYDVVEKDLGCTTS